VETIVTTSQHGKETRKSQDWNVCSRWNHRTRHSFSR